MTSSQMDTPDTTEPGNSLRNASRITNPKRVRIGCVTLLQIAARLGEKEVNKSWK